MAASAADQAAAAAAAAVQLNAKQQVYKKLADTRSAQTADGPMKLLGQHSLEIDLSATAAFQIDCLLKVLYAVPSFKIVRIRSSDRSHKSSSSSSTARRSSDAARRPSSASNADSDLSRSLVPSLARNHHLVTLELDSIPTSLVKRIPNMMKGSVGTLKHLLMRNLVIDGASLSKLMQTIASSQVYHLEMTGCGLNESCGKELKEIISIHNIRRDVAKWQDKLRDQDNSSNSSSMGLLYIDLSNNHLQDNAIRPIIEALVDDKWVKSLDLSSNSLSNSIIGEFIDLLKVNSTLSAVVVDNNPGLDKGMVALLQTTLSQRQTGVESAYGSTETDVYPIPKTAKRSSPNKVEIPSATAVKAVPTCELVRTLERLFNDKAAVSVDGFAREQFREVIDGVQKLTRTLSKTQERLKQVTADNDDLKAELQKRSAAAASWPRHRTPKRKLKKRFPDNNPREDGHRISDQDLDDIMEVIEMFESIFTQLHKYMDSVESSKSENSDLPLDNNLQEIFDQVQKSAVIFDNVASKLQTRTEQ